MGVCSHNADPLQVEHESWWFGDNVTQILSRKSESIILRVSTHVNSTMIGKLAWTSATTIVNRVAGTVRMEYKDHAGNIREDDFSVNSLASKRPKRGGRGLVIAGEHTGKVVTVVALLQKKTKYKVESIDDGDNEVCSWVEEAENVTEISPVSCN